MAVNSYWVWTCDAGTRGQKQEVPENIYRPTCSGAANGIWKQINIDDGYAFNVETLSKTELANAFGAGFLIVGTALVMSFGVRIIVKFVRDLF